MTSVQFDGDGRIPCIDCGKPAQFIGFDTEDMSEEYRCDEGHITLVPEVK